MELKPSEEFLTEALTNGTFSIEDTDKALRRSLDHSFSYLYRLQRNVVEYEEYHYTTRNIKAIPEYGDMYFDKRHRICMNFNVSLIAPHNREAYKLSKYYHQEIPIIHDRHDQVIFDLVGDKSLFTRIPVLFINNGVLKKYSIIIYDSYFTVILPFDKQFFYRYDTEKRKYPWNENIVNENGTTGNNEIEENHKIDLQIISNSIYFDYETNAPILKLQSYDGESFDRIRSINIRDIPELRTDGCYFATIFTYADDDSQYIGTPLQDVDIIDEEDIDGANYKSFVVNWDEDTLELIKSQKRNFTIRFIFYRYLKKHYGYRGNNVLVRESSDSPMSELFIIQKEEAETWEFPVPKENLMIMKIHAENSDGVTKHKTWELFDNRKVNQSYPHIYRVKDDVQIGDMLRVYYFYRPGYELSYIYMYHFYFRYLYFKWGQPLNMKVEEIVNKLYFGDFDISKEFNINFDELEPIAVTKQAQLLVKDGKLTESQAGTYFEFVVGLSHLEENPDNEEILNLFFDKADLSLYNPLSDTVAEFWNVFNFVIEHEIVDYRYDDLDFLKGINGKSGKTYYDTLSPFEYKVKKLKEFIKDDLKCFHEYLLQQNKTSIKHDFIVTEDMSDHIREVSEVNHYTFEEPMYVFTFEKLHSDENVSARFFIDGYFFGGFTHENNGFLDFIYIPVAAMPIGSLVEVEFFPSYVANQDLTFTDTNTSIEFLLEKKDDIIPTLSDIVISDKDDIYHVYEHDNFELKVIDESYNFYTSTDTTEDVYRIKSSRTLEGSVWRDNLSNDKYVAISDTKNVYRETVETTEVIDRLSPWGYFLNTSINGDELFGKLCYIISVIEKGDIAVSACQNKITAFFLELQNYLETNGLTSKMSQWREDYAFFSDCKNIRTKDIKTYWIYNPDVTKKNPDDSEETKCYQEYDDDDILVSNEILTDREIRDRVEAGALYEDSRNIIQYAHYGSDGVFIGYVTKAEIPETASNDVIPITKVLGEKVKFVKNGEEYSTEGYYTSDGIHHRSNGQPDKEGSISKELLEDLITSGIAEKYDMYPTNNEFLIKEDANYIDYTLVADDSRSIINEANRGMNSTRLYKVSVTLKNEELLNKELLLRINKTSIFNYDVMTYTNYPCTDMNIINPKGDEYIRVFKNGRLLSKNKYGFITNLNNPRVQLFERTKKGTKICIDGTPYRNRLIYFKSRLDINEEGEIYVDLRGYINKPFDLRYYEVYLNGRRLSRLNIFPISQWEIRLGGVHSIYSLEIYEKDRDWEYYGCDFGDYFTVSDLFEKTFMEKEIKDKIIKEMLGDIPPNDNSENYHDWNKDLDFDTLGFEIFYYNRLIPLGLATPEEIQFNYNDIKENFEIIYNLFITHDDFNNNVVLLNPDIYYPGEAKNHWSVYLTGNDDKFAEGGFIEDLED